MNTQTSWCNGCHGEHSSGWVEWRKYGRYRVLFHSDPTPPGIWSEPGMLGRRTGCQAGNSLNPSSASMENLGGRMGFSASFAWLLVVWATSAVPPFVEGSTSNNPGPASKAQGYMTLRSVPETIESLRATLHRLERSTDTAIDFAWLKRLFLRRIAELESERTGTQGNKPGKVTSRTIKPPDAGELPQSSASVQSGDNMQIEV
jgi:hypothetical protein